MITAARCLLSRVNWQLDVDEHLDRERTMASEKEERIRAKAHEIWLSEGCPEGSETRHWEMAAAVIEAEDAPPVEVAAEVAPEAAAEVVPEAGMETAPEAAPAPKKRAPRAKKAAAAPEDGSVAAPAPKKPRAPRAKKPTPPDT
jgi:hypothetical protein